MRAVTANKITGAVGVVRSILWIPLMFAAFFTYGIVLMFLPNLMLHWRFLRTGPR